MPRGEVHAGQMGTDEAPQDRRFRIGDLGEPETAAAIVVALAQQAPGRRDGRAEAVAADVDVALHRRIRIDGRALGGAETTGRNIVARIAPAVDHHVERQLDANVHPFVALLVSQVGGLVTLQRAVLPDHPVVFLHTCPTTFHLLYYRV